MDVKAVSARLDPDQFAFYFSGEGSVPADLLGDFLKRAAAVTRKRGIDLEIVALEPGSLAVVTKVLRRLRSRALKEYDDAPVATLAGGAGLVALAVTAVVSAMAPNGSKADALAKSGSQIIINGNVETIQVVTQDRAIEVMNRTAAEKVQPNAGGKASRLVGVSDVRAVMEEGRKGELFGEVLDVRGQLHFRPSNRRFLVPIEMSRSSAAPQLFEGGRYRVVADLVIVAGQPDSMIVHRAFPMADK